MVARMTRKIKTQEPSCRKLARVGLKRNPFPFDTASNTGRIDILMTQRSGEASRAAAMGKRTFGSQQRRQRERPRRPGDESEDTATLDVSTAGQPRRRALELEIQPGQLDLAAANEQCRTQLQDAPGLL